MPRSKSSKKAQGATAIFKYSDGAISFQSKNLANGSADFLEPILEELATMNVAEANMLKRGPKSIFTNPELPLFEDTSTIECFASLLKDAREGYFPKGKKLTREEVGNVLGISGTAIQKKEAGECKKIDKEDLRSFSLLFQVTPHYLVGLVSDSHGYLLTNGVKKALTLHYPDFDPNKYQQEENAHVTLTAPMEFPSEAVCIRGQLILYHMLLDGFDLLQMFLILAERCFEDQKRVLARFADLPFLHKESINNTLLWAASEEFQENWCNFIVQPEVLKQHQILSDALAIFADLGKRNFECLDTLARISCVASPAHKEMIGVLLEESLGIHKPVS